MQVRGRAVRGLGLHLARLDAANQELYNVGIDGERVRNHIRDALDDAVDATVRVTVFQRDTGYVSVMITVRPPVEAPSVPQALKSVVYQRPVPHIKHTGSFGQIHYGLRAEPEGYDDVLLIDRDEVVSETGIANVLCQLGGTFAWPDARLSPGSRCSYSTGRGSAPSAARSAAPTCHPAKRSFSRIPAESRPSAVSTATTSPGIPRSPSG